MSFTRFGSLPPEIRQMIWHQALHEEVDARLIFVHRPTMRVMPHTTTANRVMNANQEARDCGLEFYDVKLDVWTLSVDVQPAAEFAEFEKWPPSKDFTRGHPALDVARGMHGALKRAILMQNFLLFHLASKLEHQVAKLLKAPLPKRDDPANSTRRRGTLYLSSKYDRFALAKMTLTTQSPWGWRSMEMCERAFLRNYLCRDLDHFTRERARLSPRYIYQAGGNPEDDFLSHHMAGRIPNDVVRRIQRLVYLSDGTRSSAEVTSGTHNCGNIVNYSTREWKLGAFKGASEFYTAYMVTIPSQLDVGNINLIEWEKISEGSGALRFSCKCRQNKGQSRERKSSRTPHPQHADADHHI
ncbi:hypothetical protein PG989_013618 [Apiospora arundinis]